MFSIPDIMAIGTLALLLFGPDKLPGMMRQFGKVSRDLQNASANFVAEMERAAESPPQPSASLEIPVTEAAHSTESPPHDQPTNDRPVEKPLARD